MRERGDGGQFHRRALVFMQWTRQGLKIGLHLIPWDCNLPPKGGCHPHLPLRGSLATEVSTVMAYRYTASLCSVGLDKIKQHDGICGNDRSTTGSRRALTHRTCKRPRRCWKGCPDDGPELAVDFLVGLPSCRPSSVQRKRPLVTRVSVTSARAACVQCIWAHIGVCELLA
jgi:hypothetical protein